MYIYIHVPFCQSRCIYCDFYVVLEKYGGQQAYVEALIREIDLRLGGREDELPVIETVYIGGGTPSLLNASDYQRILDRLSQWSPIAPGAEITIEANPGAMRDRPDAYVSAGFNRVSVGIQSLNDQELKQLSRIHSATEATGFVDQLRQAGFANISVDLMYGTPGQTQVSWHETLARICALDVEHVSMYGLKVEEATPLDKLVRLGAYHLPGEDDHVAMYFAGLARLTEAGLKRYEFSNLAKPGCESRHNLNYWQNGEYLALGPGAHGYMDGVRYENIANLKQWLDNPLAGTHSTCPREEQLENALIFGLRMAQGVHIPALEATYDIDFNKQYGDILAKYDGEGLFRMEDDHLMLSEKAIPVSNSLLAEFLRGS